MLFAHLALLLLLILPRAQAELLDWSLALEPGHVARIEVVGPGDQVLVRFLAADDSHRSQFGWRPDEDPRPGHVVGHVELWLHPGAYLIRERLPGATTERVFEAISSSARNLPVTLPPGATGMLAWRRSEGAGQDAFAWSPALPGNVTFLTLGSGTWRAWATGSVLTDVTTISPRTTAVSFQRWQPPSERPSDSSRRWMVLLCLLPVTALLLVLGARGAWRHRRARGLGVALVFSAGVAALAISPVLGSLGHALLVAGEGFTDPTDSVAQVGCMADALPRLSDICHTYSWPEGATWLVTGPAWLGYLAPALISAVSNPLVGHNLGIGLHLMLLCLAAWALTRSLGGGPWTSLLAGAGAALAPVVMDELDALSLDRSTLFLVPVFFLCLHKATREEGWRWPVAAGAALAAVFYGQIHYGLYLAIACPLLVLPRLLGPRPGRRLGRMALTAGVALALLAPGLLVLELSTRDTPQGQPTTSLRHTSHDLLHPVGLQAARDYIHNFDPRRGGGADPPMASPEDRLLAAVARSITLRDFITPSELLAGRGALWLYALLALMLAARGRRRVVAQATLDVAILLLFALGPFLRLGDGIVHLPLPYYPFFLWVPGFEQLKQVYRFVLLASTISAVQRCTISSTSVAAATSSSSSGRVSSVSSGSSSSSFSASSTARALRSASSSPLRRLSIAAARSWSALPTFSGSSTSTALEGRRSRTSSS